METATRSTRSFTVSFDLEKSFIDLITAGNYHFVDGNITPENFPLNVEGRREMEIFLLYFDRSISDKDVIEKMDREELRPATLTHALAFGAQHPNESEKHSTVFLGSPWERPDGNIFVAALREDEGKYGLYLYIPSDDRWGSGYFFPRFAAVRK